MRIAVSTNCDWTDEKLGVAIADLASKDDEMTNVRVVHSLPISGKPQPGDSYYAKVFDLDAALGI